MNSRTLLITFLILAHAVTIQAQSDSAENNVQFKLGAYHNTQLHYYGRTDSLKSSGWFSVAELWLDKNLYINAAPVFTQNKMAGFQYAGAVLTAGYIFNDNKKWAGHFYFLKPLYKSNSQLVQSALKAQISSSLTFQGKFLNITGGADMKFSDKIDVGTTAGIDHLFRFELPGPAVLAINPTATIHAGTQQFTKTYYKQSNFIFFPGINQTVTEEVSQFNILSYELSSPVVLAKGKFQFLFIPGFVMPQNLVTIPGRPDLSERGRNLFYVTIGTKIIL